ncbi:MAG: hypothetical protein AB7K52_08970 [Phycisphaerales bacterium]
MALHGQFEATCARRALTAAAAVAAASAVSSAQLAQFDDLSVFVAQTGAVPNDPWPNQGRLAGDANASFHHGMVTLTVASPSSGLWVGSGGHVSVGPDWTTLVPGHDIAIDGRENLNVDFSAPVRAAGFMFAEATMTTVLYHPCSGLCPCANSSFTVTLLRGGAPVAQFQFSRPDDTTAFVGVSSPTPFDRLEIREVGGTCDDEYFGQIFYSLCAGACCAADFNGDGSIDPDDLGDYINCYFSNPPCLQADFNRDGSVDPDDLGDFINTYFSPC